MFMICVFAVLLFIVDKIIHQVKSIYTKINKSNEKKRN